MFVCLSKGNGRNCSRYECLFASVEGGEVLSVELKYFKMRIT